MALAEEVPEAISKTKGWGERRKRTAARRSIPVTRRVDLERVGDQAGSFCENGCALCTASGDDFEVCASEVSGVLWPMCRTCRSRLSAHQPGMRTVLIEACARIAFSARNHGMTIKTPGGVGEDERPARRSEFYAGDEPDGEEAAYVQLR